MKAAKLAMLRFFALLFLLPGFVGLILSAVISEHYLDVMPGAPALAEGRIVPREIHGVVIYQTAEEDERLTEIEYSFVGVFVIGLALGLVYLEQRGSLLARTGEEEGKLAEGQG